MTLRTFAALPGDGCIVTRGEAVNIRALIIGIGSWGPLYHHSNKEPLN